MAQFDTNVDINVNLSYNLLALYKILRLTRHAMSTTKDKEIHDTLSEISKEVITLIQLANIE